MGLRGPGSLPIKVGRSAIVAGNLGGRVGIKPAERIESPEMGGAFGSSSYMPSGFGGKPGIPSAIQSRGGSKPQQPDLPLTGSTRQPLKPSKNKPKPERKPGKRQEAATTAKDLGIEVKPRDTAATINQKIEAHRAKELQSGRQQERVSKGEKQRKKVLQGKDRPIRSQAGIVAEKTRSTSGPSKFVSPQQRAIEAAEAVRSGRAGTTATGQKALPAPKVETPKPPKPPRREPGPTQTPNVIQLPTKKPADTSGPYTPGAGPQGGLGRVESTAARARRQKEARAEHEKRIEQARSSGFNQFSSRHPDASKPAAPHLQGRGVKPTFTQQAGITMRSTAKKAGNVLRGSVQSVRSMDPMLKEIPRDQQTFDRARGGIVDLKAEAIIVPASMLVAKEVLELAIPDVDKSQSSATQPKPKAQPKAPVIQSTTKKPVQIKKSTAVISAPKNYPSFTPPTGATIPGVPGMVMDKVFGDASLVQSGRSKASKPKTSQPKSVKGFTPNTNDMLKRQGKKPQAKLSLPSNYGGLAGQAGEIGKHVFAAPVQLTSHVFGGIEVGAGALRKLLGG